MRREFPAAGVAHIAPHPSLNEPRDGGLYVLLAFLGGRARTQSRADRRMDQLITAAQQSAVYRAVDKHDQMSALCRVTGSLLPRRRCCCFISS